jgi:hypothetical protein
MNRPMTQTTILALLVVAVVLVLAGGGVLAKDFQCGPPTAGA